MEKNNNPVMNKTSYIQFERIGSKLNFIIIKSQLYRILPFISNRFLFFCSKCVFIIINLFYAKSSSEIKQRISKGLDITNKNKINIIYKKYIQNLFYHLFIALKIPYLSRQKIDKMFTLEEESINILSRITKKNIFAMSHFYQIMIVIFLSKKTYDKNIKLLATYSFKKEKTFSNFINKLNIQRYSCFHNHINMSTIKNIREFIKKLKISENIAMHGDVRFKNNKNDIEFNLNDLICYSNNGLYNIINEKKDFNKYYISIKRINYKFQIKIRKILSIEEYYYLLTNDIIENPSDWLLWFHTPMFKN